ncbi:MAG: 4-(cytidine 5'-diphospho)-2-C-methyl-D-erythritol kinase [Candidatus Marinimicrobia bacterium]|mgnify:CR=1 FL=1|nr:4-(cytidine 5'-diphospho)-2-C-methyl-D-erythritol kinase [Candidatus Neomarinimicrobiota bacterium]|tara:strand:- start:3684 stop:4556 length:873 start_codon:yes stop_codon:yes gene_type:complete
MSSNEILLEKNLSSNAKVNIGLNIFDKNSNGYHILESLMQEVSLSDNICIKVYSCDGGVIFKSKGQPINCSTKENSCYKITSIVKKQYNIKNKICIELNKKIPLGSGLGGGSSNAACILNFLDTFFNIKITKKEKINICRIIGMDVPFFINGGLQYAEGMGDQTSIMPPIFKDKYFVIACPQFSISTKWAYSKINKNLLNKKKLYNLLALEDSIKWDFFRNDFEEVVIPRYPEVRELKKAMLSSGAVYSSLSGSGSTVFGIYNNFNQAKSFSDFIDYKKYHITVTSPIYR